MSIPPTCTPISRTRGRLKNKPCSVKRARQLWDRFFLPKLGKRRVKDVQWADIAKLIGDMADTPAMANKVVSLASTAFNLAEVWGSRPEGTNPCRHIQRYRKEARERFLSESELAASRRGPLRSVCGTRLSPVPRTRPSRA